MTSRPEGWATRIFNSPFPLRVGFCAALTLVILLVRLLLVEQLGDRMIYVVFYPALLASALLCGTRGGIVAMLFVLASTHVPLFGRQITVFDASVDSLAFVIFVINGGLTLAFAFGLRTLLRRRGVLDDLARKDAEQLGQFIEQTPAAMAMFDRDMRYVAASARWRQDYGLDRDVIGKSHYDVMPDIGDAWKCVHGRAMAGETVRRERDSFQRADGHTILLRWEARPWRNPNDGIGGVLIFSEDITERVTIRQALEDNERRLKATLDAAMEAIVTIDGDGKIVSANPAATEIFGYAQDELLGRDVNVLMSSPYRDQHATYMAHYNSSHEQKIIGRRRELEGRHKDGSIFPLELTVSEARVNEGTIYVGFMRDLSPIEAERRRVNALRDELIHVSRLNDMGEVVAGLAHEVGQPVAAILNFAAAHRRASAAGGPGPEPEMMARIESQARRAADILKRLRGFIEKRPAEREVETIGVLIAEAMKLAAPRSQAQIVFAAGPSSDIEVYVDRIQIEQVLINLLRNADEAVRQVETPRICVNVTQPDPGHVAVRVADNGQGVEPEARDKLFSAFFSTRRLGMGVGLSISKNLVEAHSGAISFHENTPRGAIFEFVLPVFEQGKRLDG